MCPTLLRQKPIKIARRHVLPAICPPNARHSVTGLQRGDEVGSARRHDGPQPRQHASEEPFEQQERRLTSGLLWLLVST